MDERKAFERYFSEEGKWPGAVERDQRGEYRLSVAASAWVTWQARAALAAPQAEPVAWISDQAVALLQAGEGPVRAVPEEYPECGFVVPLYAAPPAPDAQEVLRLADEMVGAALTHSGIYRRWVSGRASDETMTNADLAKNEARSALAELLGVAA